MFIKIHKKEDYCNDESEKEKLQKSERGKAEKKGGRGEEKLKREEESGKVVKAAKEQRRRRKKYGNED